ncbi:MAG: MoaD/ThiS family protein [Rhodospirillales bacterium]|nr:MoaD/ThiS family protein [Rhodospirillales bacterium]
MRVLIPGLLRSYTHVREVEGTGATLAEILADLDRRHPGLRFRIVDEQDRIRPHIRIFLDGRQAYDLAAPVRAESEVQIVQALSGG